MPPAASLSKNDGEASPKEGQGKGEGWLAAAGLAAAGLALAGLVQGHKGSNDPAGTKAPAANDSNIGRRGMEITGGIWTQPEPWPTTTGNEWLDQQLGYTGAPKPRRRWP